MTLGNVIRIDANGPDGLDRWEEMNPDELASGTPVQNGHTYHEIEEVGYLAGVWDCTAFDAHPGPYEVDEFMWLIEGEVTMVMPDGSEVTTRAGEAFVIPKGLECQWKMPRYVRKYFMILDGPVPEGGANPALSRVTKPDLAGPDVADDVQAEQTSFVNAAGTMRVSVRSCADVVAPSVAINAHSLIHVLDGQLTVTEDGTDHVFAKGETVYIKKGAIVGWATSAGTRQASRHATNPIAVTSTR